MTSVEIILSQGALPDEMPEAGGAVLLIEDTSNLHVFNYGMDEVCWWGEAEDEQTFEELKQRFQVR